MYGTPIFRLFVRLATVQFLIFGSIAQSQSIRLNWSKDATEFWYQDKDEEGRRLFLVVDIENRTREPAFDHQQIRQVISKEFGNENPTDVRIDRIAFSPTKESLFVYADGRRWIVNRKTNVLAETSAVQTEPETQLFLPPRSSRNSDERTDVHFDNRLGEEVELVWIATDGRRRSYGRIPANKITPFSTFVGHTWLITTASGKVLGCYESRSNEHVILSDETVAAVKTQPKTQLRKRRNNQPDSRLRSPDGKWVAFVRNHDLWLRQSIADEGEKGERQLTDNGSEQDSFLQNVRQNVADGDPDIRWSPDSSYLVAFQTAPVDVRKVYFIESSPKDQLQPKLHDYRYPKPGDPIAAKTLRLFSVANEKEIPVSNERFENPYEIQFLGWSESGKQFRLLYNERGHQVLRLVEVNLADGEVRTIAEDTSETFLHYSDGGKNFHQFLPNNEVLWASERSGWNHLYRYDVATGAVINSVTTGDWNVKRIEKVDSEKKQVWFYAVGVIPDQDPYHEHFCRVNFDGSDFRVLSEGDGTHKIQFEQNGKYFTDTWSRVDFAPVVEIRESETGELISELTRKNASDHFKERRLTERFVSVGRDGETPIWGIIHFPKNFEPGKKYPVVENIYAGPHDQHVPKSYRSRYGCYRIADAGMIVVQIDGMGTAWRSKKFHDVCFKNLRDAGFPDRIAWIKAAARKFPQMDLSRIGIYGGSAGAQNAMAALLWHHDFYKVAVADCGCHDNRMDKRWWNEQWMGYPVDESYVENSNMENAHLLQGKLMLIVGEMDRNVDPASTTQVVSKLIGGNKDFEFVLVPGTGHGSTSNPWAARKRLDFLKKHLAVE